MKQHKPKLKNNSRGRPRLRYKGLAIVMRLPPPTNSKPWIVGSRRTARCSLASKQSAGFSASRLAIGSRRHRRPPATAPGGVRRRRRPHPHRRPFARAARRRGGESGKPHELRDDERQRPRGSPAAKHGRKAYWRIALQRPTQPSLRLNRPDALLPAKCPVQVAL
jgi:hypothetical protein